MNPIHANSKTPQRDSRGRDAARSARRTPRGTTRLFLLTTLLCFVGSFIAVPSQSETCAGAIPPTSGQATYYIATEGNACGLPIEDEPPMVAALSTDDFDGSAACGRCLDVTGPLGSVVVRVTDHCGDCQLGHLDLSPEAFAEIGDLAAGHVPITWKSVPCQVEGPMSFYWKDGSSEWWSALQVRNHRYGIASLAVHDQGTWVPLARTGYNFFDLQNPPLQTPLASTLDLRITDVHGAQRIETDVLRLADAEFQGSSQLPVCMPEPAQLEAWALLALLLLVRYKNPASDFGARITLVGSRAGAARGAARQRAKVVEVAK